MDVRAKGRVFSADEHIQPDPKTMAAVKQQRKRRIFKQCCVGVMLQSYRLSAAPQRVLYPLWTDFVEPRDSGKNSLSAVFLPPARPGPGFGELQSWQAPACVSFGTSIRRRHAPFVPLRFCPEQHRQGFVAAPQCTLVRSRTKVAKNPPVCCLAHENRKPAVYR